MPNMALNSDALHAASRHSGRRLALRQNSMRSFLTALLFLIPLAASAEQCPVTENSLLGAWERKSESGFFEEMSFKIEGEQKIFNSWLHHRPEISGGTWKLANCTIFIAHPTEKSLSVEFVVLKASKNRVHVREVGEKDTSVYQLIK